MDYELLKKVIVGLQGFVDAHEAVLAGQAIDLEQPPEPVDPNDVLNRKTEARNRALANGGAKAELLGTLSTEPTIDENVLISIGVDKVFAASLIAERNKIRAEAFALSPIAEK